MKYLVAFQKRPRFIDDICHIETRILDYYPTPKDLEEILFLKHWDDEKRRELIAITELRGV